MSKNDRDWHKRKHDSIEKKREALDRLDKALANGNWEEYVIGSEEFKRENRNDRIEKSKP